MTEQLFWRLAAGTLGGILAAASAFKVISMDDFRDWVALLLGPKLARPLRFLAPLVVGTEAVLGALLLFLPARPTVALGLALFLAFSLVQLITKLRRLGSCACFGAASGSQGAMLGPVLAPALAVWAALLLGLEPSPGPALSVWEQLVGAGAALASSLTLLIVVAAPSSLRELKVESRNP